MLTWLILCLDVLLWWLVSMIHPTEYISFFSGLAVGLIVILTILLAGSPIFIVFMRVLEEDSDDLVNEILFILKLKWKDSK